MAEEDDVALARTIASDFPRTHVPGTDVRSADPALAATITPDVTLSSPGRASSTLTAEHPGRYVRQGELGRGGMGRVIVVKDTHLGREVALKELLDQSVPNNDAMSIGSAARFLREARITGQLEHPGIVPVHELGQRADGTIYYTMKRIRGRSFASILAEKTTLKERLTLLAIFRNVCEAVAYAHSKGVVHRDLKPDNVMVGDFGDTLVVDWGLAKVRGEAEIVSDRVSGQSGRNSSHDDLARTMDGHAIGTPAYMSPEQARGELGSIDERADVWGLGTILYEILAGHPPYVGTSALDVLAKVLDTPPPPVIEAAPDAPVELAAIVDRSLMRDASSRYPNAGEVAKEIGAYLDGRTVGAYEYSTYELWARFVRKHRAASLAVASIALSILVASIVVYRSFLDESRARAFAETARDDAMQQRSSAEDSMHAAESAVADALLERAERALADGDTSGAAVFAAGVLVRDAGAAMHVPPERHVRALTLYLEAQARVRYVFERTIGGGHVRSCLSTDGRTMAIPTETAIRLVNLDDASERHVEVHATRVRALGPNGLAVIASDASGVYDLSDGHRVMETAPPTSAQITDIGILVASANGSLRVLSPDGSSELASWTSAYRGQVRATLSPAGDRVAVVSTDTPELEIWPWPITRTAAPERVALRAVPFVAAFSPRGERLALLASDFVATIRIELGKQAHVREIVTHSWPVALAWDHDAALALYESGDRITIRDPNDGHVLDVVHFPAANGGRVDAAGDRLVFFPSESRTALSDATVLRAVSSGERDAALVSSVVRDVQLDPARHRVIAASLTGIWALPLGPSAHLGTPSQLAPMPEASGLVAHARVTPDGAVVLSTLRGAVAVLEPGADAATLAWPAVADATTAVGLRGIALSNDGETIYSGSPTERSVLVWSRHTHSAEAPIPASSSAQALAVSPDGSVLAIGGRDGSVQLVTLAEGTVAHTMIGDEESISAMAFSPRGDRLAVADQSGRVRLLDARAHVVTASQPHRRFINGVAWSSDGRWLVTAADDPAVAVLSAADLTPVRFVRTSTATISASLGADASHLLFHDGRSVVQLDLRLAMTDVDAAALLSRAEDQAGVRLDGLLLAPRE